MMAKRPALPAGRVPGAIAHLVRRQPPFHDSLTQPGNLVPMVATGETGGFSGSIPDENGRGAIERFVNRSPRPVPERGFGA